MWDILWLIFIRDNCKVCFPFLGYAWTWLWKCINFFSAVIYYMKSPWFTTFVYTTFSLKPEGGTTALLSPSAHFWGNSFPSLVHLVFKSLKHLPSVDTKQSGRTPVLEEAMTSRFYCFARKSQKISARKYRLSKKLDARFHRSISENFKVSLSNVPWARVGNFWQNESIKSLSVLKGLRRSRRHFDRHRM